MAKVLIWAETPRDALDLGESVVVLPIGATEQHGPHLPTGTDALLAAHIALLAANRAVLVSARDVIIAPCLPFGVSSHHQPFGGTLSVTSATLLSVLNDLLDSLEAQGARRVLIVNGHGGNSGISKAAAAGADGRERLTVAAVNYWEVDGIRELGHAGAVETSLVLTAAPNAVALERAQLVERTESHVPKLPGMAFHAAWLWRIIEGFTDDPTQASADRGATYLEHAVEGLAQGIVHFAALRAE